ncbi:MAG: gliding motility-associated C-terminal domain-containing protein [Bacteroidales bacterium]|nr:gliding motility-associated C-terminal domain-containing protein [Bacteroidales bacterium]
MRKTTATILFLVAFIVHINAQSSAIYFTENKNQWNSKVLFRSQLYGGYVFAEKNCLTYYFRDNNQTKHRHATQAITEQELDSSRKYFIETGKQLHLSEKDKIPDSVKSHAYQVKFSGMNTRTKIYGLNQTPYTENYIKGSNPKNWVSNVRSYRDILYEDIYKNIDLHLYGNETDLKYDFIIHPGGNAQKIKLEYMYVPSMKLRKDGVLVIQTSVNEIYEQKPFAFQIINNDTIEIPCNYHLEHFIVTYDLGAYNPNYDLYIDPNLIFSTYTGSTSDNWGFTATYDSQNNAYLGGIVDGFGYPVNMGAIQESYAGGNWDIGLMKLDETGKNRLYATYLGGKSCEMPHSLIVNSKNELLILGTTGSSDFPISNGYQTKFSGGESIIYDNTIKFEDGVDIFVAKIAADGSSILSSTFLGGTKNDGINFSWEEDLYYGYDSLYYNYGDGARGEIMIDDNDFVYIASTTFSDDFPIVNGFQKEFGGMQDGIICKFNPDLSSLLWSSYIGGDSKDAAYSIDVDHDQSVYVTGGTCSSDLNLPSGGYITQRIGGTVDAFVLKINKNNGTLDGGTYFGSTSYDQAHFIRVNSNNNVFIFGQTTAPGKTLIYNAEYNQPNSGQFLASFNSDLNELRWSTVFGNGSGKPNISPTAFEVDICNRIYLAGVGRDWPETYAEWYYYGNYYTLYYDYGWVGIPGTKGMEVTDDAYQKETDGKDFYILVIDDEAQTLNYASFFGEIGDGHVIYTPDNGYVYYGCSNSGRDHVDGGTSRFDANGYVYQSVCASCGGCNGFPVYPNPGVWSTKNNSSNCNAAVFRFVIDFGLISADFDIPEVGCVSKEVTFKNTTQIHYNNPNVTYTWDFGDGTISHEKSPSHTYEKSGNYTVTLSVQDLTSCNQSDVISKEFQITTQTKHETLETQNICLGESILIGIPNEFDENLEYSWSPETWLTDPSKPQTYVKPTETQTYQLTITSGWCQTIYEQTVNTFNESYFIEDIDVMQNGTSQVPKICLGEKVRLEARTNAPSQRYLWSTDKNFSKIINPDFSVNYIYVMPQETTTYYVKTLSTFCEFEATASITIEVFHNKISASGEAQICAGDIVEISVENDNLDNQLWYKWEPKEFVKSGATAETALVNPTTTTDFIVTATDIIGCEYTDTVHIEVDNLTVRVKNQQAISCAGDNNAAISIEASGISPYEYVWENGSTETTRTDLGPGTYEITVTDSLGCKEILEFNIKNPDLLKIDTTTFTNETCKNACNGTIHAYVSGGTKPYKLRWSNGDTTEIVSNLCSKPYSLEVTDAHGCKVKTSNDIVITLEEKLPELNAFAEKTRVYVGQSTKIYATTEPSDSITYIWTPNILLEDNSKAITTFTPDIAIDLTYKVIAFDKYGCQSTDTIHITSTEWICDNPFIFVPTAFTPNNDGKNDFVKVNSDVISELEFAIFDRWGEKIFETNNINDYWDGTYHNKPLQPQVFVYYLKATCLNGEKYETKGNITLIR